MTEPIPEPCAILLQRFPRAVELPGVFLGHRRDAHDPPHRMVALSIARQQTQQAGQVESIGLRPSGSAIHLNARRVDHMIGNPACEQIAMQPEPIAPRFVTADHWRVRWHV